PPRKVAVLNSFERAHASVSNRVDRLAIHLDGSVADRDRRACVAKMANALQGDLVSHKPVVGPDLSRKIDVFAAQRPPAALDAAEHQVKTDQLPDGIDAQTPRLH